MLQSKPTAAVLTTNRPPLKRPGPGPDKFVRIMIVHLEASAISKTDFPIGSATWFGFALLF
jgi:hypothetical protein